MEREKIGRQMKPGLRGRERNPHPSIESQQASNTLLSCSFVSCLLASRKAYTASKCSLSHQQTGYMTITCLGRQLAWGGLASTTHCVPHKGKAKGVEQGGGKQMRPPDASFCSSLTSPSPMCSICTVCVCVHVGLQPLPQPQWVSAL